MRSAGCSNPLTPATPTTPTTPCPSSTDEDAVDLVVKFDFGWDKRGSGFKYDSHSGRGSVIGDKTNKILGYAVISKYCAMCEHGHNPEDHECVKNHDGSSKSMEPKAAAKLCLDNPHFTAAGVRVKKFIGDRDSSTIAALRAQSRKTGGPEIEKIVDLNHNIKGVNNALYKLDKKHKFLKSDVINYIKRCVNYAITSNKGDVDAVRKAILNVANHFFGEHGECSDWCKAKGQENYAFKHLPQEKPFSCPVWRADLVKILTDQANEAES